MVKKVEECRRKGEEDHLIRLEAMRSIAWEMPKTDTGKHANKSPQYASFLMAESHIAKGSRGSSTMKDYWLTRGRLIRSCKILSDPRF
jgi:hypothetical protein